MAALQGSIFNATASCGNHARSDWEIATDPNFNNIVAASENDGVNLTEWIANLPVDDPIIGPQVTDNLLFARLRYKSSTCVSEWSETAVCLSGDLPDGQIVTPTLVVQGQPNNITTGPQLVTGSFVVLENVSGDTLHDIHVSTDWIVQDATGTIVWSSMTDAENKISIYIPDGTLIPGQDYTFMARHRGLFYGESNFVTYVGSVMPGPFVEAPNITIEGAPNTVPTNPLISASAFTASGGTIVHTTTDWIIEDTTGAVIWNSVLTGAPHLTSIQPPLGTLQYGNQYVVKVRYSGLDSITNSYVNSQYTVVNIISNFSGTWKVLPLAPEGKKAHGQVTLPNGHVWIAGGVDTNGIMSNSGYTLQLDYINGGGLWVAGPNLFAASKFHAMTADGLGSIFVSGGYESTVNGDVITATTYSYNPTNDTWTNRAPLPTPRYNHRQSLMPSNLIIVTGGYDGTNILDSCYMYNPNTDTYTQIADLPIPLHGHGQSVVNGMVYITGGLTTTGQSDRIFIYDSLANTWSEAMLPSTPLNPNTPAVLPSPRYFHIQETINDHSFMIAAGRNDIGILDSAFIFDETADPRFIPVDHMPVGRELAASSIIIDGTIVVTGGSSNGSDALVIPQQFV